MKPVQTGKTAGKPDLSKTAILVADANSFFRELTCRALHGFGARQLYEVPTGAAAELELSRHHVDLMICDAVLEDGSGFDLVRSIRARKDHPHRDIPILLSAENVHMAEFTRARDAGANAVLKKPLSPEVIYEHLIWVTAHPREFRESETYYGPDRRTGRRKDYQGPDRRQARTEAPASGDDKA